MNSNDRLLRLALRCNATFSTLCALAALVGGSRLATTLGIPDPTFLPVLAVNLAVFAGFLVWLSTRDRIAPALGWGVVAADLFWVLGTVPAVSADLLTSTGDRAAIAVAAFVGLWAALQAMGLRRMSAAVPAA